MEKREREKKMETFSALKPLVARVFFFKSAGN